MTNISPSQSLLRQSSQAPCSLLKTSNDITRRGTQSSHCIACSVDRWRSVLLELNKFGYPQLEAASSFGRGNCAACVDNVHGRGPPRRSEPNSTKILTGCSHIGRDVFTAFAKLWFNVTAVTGGLRSLPKNPTKSLYKSVLLPSRLRRQSKRAKEVRFLSRCPRRRVGRAGLAIAAATTVLLE